MKRETVWKRLRQSADEIATLVAACCVSDSPIWPISGRHRFHFTFKVLAQLTWNHDQDDTKKKKVSLGNGVPEKNNPWFCATPRK